MVVEDALSITDPTGGALIDNLNTEHRLKEWRRQVSKQPQGVDDKLEERLDAAIPTNHRGVKPLLQQTKPKPASGYRTHRASPRSSPNAARPSAPPPNPAINRPYVRSLECGRAFWRSCPYPPRRPGHGAINHEVEHRVGEQRREKAAGELA